MKSVLSQAGSSLLASRHEQLPVSPVKQEQTVRFLISNGNLDGNFNSNNDQSRFKAKQHLSYNDFYYSQTPHTQTDYAKILDAQIAQKREFTQIQEENQRNNRSLNKVNNINPHLIPAEPNLAPNYGFQIGAQTKYGNSSGYSSGFQPKNQLQRTGPMIPMNNNSNLFNGSQQSQQYPNASQPGLISQMYSQGTLKTAQQMSLGRSRAISQEDLGGISMLSRLGQSGYVPPAGQLANSSMQTRGMLRRENISEEQQQEKERLQREMNFALQEQVLHKKKQKELEERKNRLEDLFFEQKMKIVQHQDNQVSRQGFSSHRAAAPPSPKVQFPANKTNMQIDTLHAKADKNRIKSLAAINTTAAPNNPTGSTDDVPDFSQAKQIPRTPPTEQLQHNIRMSEQQLPQYTERAPSQLQLQAERVPTLSQISPRQTQSQRIPSQLPHSSSGFAESELISHGMSSSRFDNNLTSAHGRASAATQQQQLPTRGRQLNTVQEEEDKRQAENDIDYFQDYYEFQTKVFNRQMATLQRDVNNVNTTRNQVFKDMLHLREQSKQEHLMNLIKPSDVLEDNRLWLAQRKQNLYTQHKMEEYLKNPYLTDIPYLNPPGQALQNALLEQSQYYSPQLIFKSELVPDASIVPLEQKKKKKFVLQSNQNQQTTAATPINQEPQIQQKKRSASEGAVPKCTISDLLPLNLSKSSSVEVSLAGVSNRSSVALSPSKRHSLIQKIEENTQKVNNPPVLTRPISSLSYFISLTTVNHSEQFRRQFLNGKEPQFEKQQENPVNKHSIVEETVWEEVYSNASDDYDEVDQEIDGYFHEISQLVTSEAQPVNLNQKSFAQVKQSNQSKNTSKFQEKSNSQNRTEKQQHSQSALPLKDSSKSNQLENASNVSSQIFGENESQFNKDKNQSTLIDEEQKARQISKLHSLDYNDTLFEKSLHNLESMISVFTKLK